MLCRWLWRVAKEWVEPEAGKFCSYLNGQLCILLLIVKKAAKIIANLQQGFNTRIVFSVSNNHPVDASYCIAIIIISRSAHKYASDFVDADVLF